jgi:hypothetical protein
MENVEMGSGLLLTIINFEQVSKVDLTRLRIPFPTFSPSFKKTNASSTTRSQPTLHALNISRPSASTYR